MIEIKNRYTGICIKKSDALSLREADLRWADLRQADLRVADMRSADLSGADLRSAELSGADLRSAELSGAELSGADLSGADLRGAQLRWADLRQADLRQADLRQADLRWAELIDADLRWTVGNGKEVNTIVCDGLIAVWNKNILSIGCEIKPISAWLSMSDKKIQEIGDLDLWEKWKPIFKSLIPEEQQ